MIFFHRIKKTSIYSENQFSMTDNEKPHFIADDTLHPLPIFVTKQRDEREERLRAVNFARASVGLEGFELSKVDEEHARTYVEGEITLDEFIERANAALDE